MSRARSTAISLVAIVAGLAASGAAAQTAEPPSIQEAGSPAFPSRSYALRIPDRAALGTGDVRVRENGEAVANVGLESAALGGPGSFATVLVLDASNSMKGEPIAEAMRAARAFAQRRSPSQRIGVITFNDATNVLLPLTSDQAQIDAALDATPDLALSTHLYDAVSAGVGMLSDAAVEAGSVVVLSDGADTGSAADLSEVTGLVDESGVRVFAVGLRSQRFDPASLASLAVGGAFVEAAAPADLRPVLQAFGAQLASEYLIRYESAVEAGETVTVEVEVEGVTGVARDEYEAPGGVSVAAAEPAGGGGFWETPGAMILMIGLVAALLGTAAFAILRPRRQTVVDRLVGFTNPQVGRMQGTDSAPGGLASTLRNPLARFARALEGGDRWARFNEELDVGEIQTPATRIVATTAVGTLLVALLVVQVFSAPILIPLALLVPFAVRMQINRLVRQQRREFADQLADNLQLVASALRAGQSMAGALTVVVDEAPEPTRREFRRIVSDERLGVPLEDAIRSVARRMKNRDLDQVALVATIQRETGGNTAEILDQVIATIRERGKLRRLVETLTAQGRLTQVIVSALPLVLLCAVALLNPDYMDPLFDTGGGRIALVIGAFLSVIGSLLIKRIIEIRV